MANAYTQSSFQPRVTPGSARRIDADKRRSRPDTTKEFAETYTTNKLAQKKELLREKQRAEREGQNVTTGGGVTQQQLYNHPMYTLGKSTNKLVTTVSMKMRALSASVTIAYAVFIFWFVQLGFWLLGIVGISLELTPVVRYLLPGETLFMTANVVIIAIGIGSMLFGVLVYLLRGVHCFAGWKGLCFIFSVALYCAPFINFLPWIALWGTSVVLADD